MSTRAKATLAASFAFSSFIIWAVHYQQAREREDMFQGVIRDDARRLEKMRQREEEFRASSRKREIFEQVQNIAPSDQSNKI
ncbi:uncharacterized protein EDB91DRAFT_1219512 [Suillus paluster]|uniref:uncharacterized protein n=1 Tax=Suillus paluster TaxID=48578 RepID=UPI001B883B4E|nr:uncharacterized protein EDB91DRAFT_1219512 [Suillus paluster]KAG1746545.1 hypothetical protein EDB91DRAFT_1219512 [Suillus paluster]